MGSKVGRGPCTDLPQPQGCEHSLVREDDLGSLGRHGLFLTHGSRDRPGAVDEEGSEQQSQYTVQYEAPGGAAPEVEGLLLDCSVMS